MVKYQGSNYQFVLHKLRSEFSYCDSKVVNDMKNVKQFFSQGKFNSSTLYFSLLYPHHIHILFHHLLIYYYQRKYCLHLKLHCKMQIMLCISYTKSFAYGGLKALLHSAHLLRSELQMILRTLNMLLYTGYIYLCINVNVYIYTHK